MTMNRLLVPVRGDGKGEAVLGHALAVARRFNSHIEVVHCRARPQDMLPFGVVMPRALRRQIEDGAKSLADQEEAHLHKMLSDTLAREGVHEVPRGEIPPDDRPSVTWYEEDGKQIDVIKRHGRLADLIAVAKPDRELGIGVNSLHAALFASGRPVLLCPPEGPPPALGSRIAIAWNGALEAARALALSIGLIDRAEGVVVLDGGAGESGADGSALMTYLAQRGVSAERRQLAAGSHPGRAILAAAKEAGADTLLMGAYGHSREMEAMLGGATQEVVDETRMPVVFAH
ncbi:universal stress protein [Paralimibaculum aggregatum]|uniref:Universal stress protein n=1 Tax=Paralimibaculum aggregatum TaxID=3036245 RepID=A0ABQ6LT96_9RHOB|nr:universal stress protein [Limibaculum sp. NKW23]GMG85291.1 universal stress protein [Limibaculum sp. NKW23]